MTMISLSLSLTHANNNNNNNNNNNRMHGGIWRKDLSSRNTIRTERTNITAVKPNNKDSSIPNEILCKIVPKCNRGFLCVMMTCTSPPQGGVLVSPQYL
jgi:hypothetical protein